MTASRPPLIDPQRLLARRDSRAVCLVDCRFDLADPGAGRAAYAAGHLPGAHYLDLDEDLSGPKTGTNGRHPLPDADALAARLGQLGVGRDSLLVAYDQRDSLFAARLWWLARWLGHDNTVVLDGGLDGWVAAGGPLSTAPAQATPTVFRKALQASPVTAEALLQALHTPTLCLIDARSPDRFRGENETLDPVGGHIPGALNRFFRDNLDPAGRFKPAGVLRTEFLALLAGRRPEQSIHQCGSGVTACHNLLAMAVADLPGGRLYPGSWSEWCADPTRPVVTGAPPAG